MKKETKIRLVAFLFAVCYLVYATLIFIIGANSLMRAFGLEIIKPADKAEDLEEVKKAFEDDEEDEE